MESACVTTRPRVHDADITRATPTAVAANTAPHGVDVQLRATFGDEGRDVDALHAAAVDAHAEELEALHKIRKRHTVYIYSNVSHWES
jgi:hypothetical protein